MAVEKELLVFAVDGALMQCQLAMRVLDADGHPTEPVMPIIASLSTLRELLIGDVPVEGEDGPCLHPADKVTTTHMANGYFKTCSACNEIIEQR